RHPRRLRRRAPFHRIPPAFLTPRQRRRRQEPGDPSRLHHPPAAQRRGEGCLRRHQRHDSSLDRPGRYRRYHLGSRPGVARFANMKKTADSCAFLLADGVAANSPVNRSRFATTAFERAQILEKYKNIAMVGLSSNPFRPSHFAAIYLLAEG